MRVFVYVYNGISLFSEHVCMFVCSCKSAGSRRMENQENGLFRNVVRKAGDSFCGVEITTC